MPADLATTRRSLHAVAELVLAGPQYRAYDDIRLQVRPYGFGTVVGPDIRVVGATVVRDDVIVSIDGRTSAAIAHDLGVSATNLVDVYQDGCGVGTDDPLGATHEYAERIARSYAVGDEALARFAPEAERVLWPEHFDVAVRSDDVNYGVSPGDDEIAVPYAYVGPTEVTADPFWNARFGAAMPLPGAPSVAAVIEFFAAGRAAARAGRSPG